MNDSIVTREEMFPLAQVPGAQSLSDVFAGWKERGFKPVEMTREETIQRIVIEHDPLEGKLSWSTSPNMDGLLITLHATEAVCLMPSVIVGDAAMSIAEYFAEGKGRIDLGTGEAAVMIAFKDGRLAMDWQPKDAPIAAKKLLALALLRMITRDAGMNLTDELLRMFR